MSKLPELSGKEVLKLFTNRLGYYVRDQRGSHVHLRHPSRPPLTIPLHPTVAKGTLRAILNEAGIGRDEFFRLLRK